MKLVVKKWISRLIDDIDWHESITVGFMFVTGLVFLFFWFYILTNIF